MDALVTYGGDKVGYSAMRSLTAIGARVAVADPGRVGMSQWSRFCWKKYLLKNPYTQAEAFINDVVHILKDSGARFLLPSQTETEVLAKYRHRLPEGVILPIADYEQIKMANDKSRMASFARSIGVNVPEVIDWNTWGELEDKLLEVKSRLVVKLRMGYGSRWVYYPADAAEALALCKTLAARHSLGPDQLPVVQKWVDGEKWLVACLYHEGGKLASFTQRMLRENPITGGAGTLRVSDLNEKMQGYATRILDSMSWHGIAVVEFKYNPKSGEAWFIEINPRLWGSICHSVASGVDLVALLYIAATEGADKAKKMARAQRIGVMSRWWLGDAGLAASEAKRLRPLKALGLLMPGGTDVYDEFRWDDPGATAGAIARPLARLLRLRKDVCRVPGNTRPESPYRDSGKRTPCPSSGPMRGFHD